MLHLMQQGLSLPSFNLLGVELALSVVLSFDGGFLGFVVVGLTVRSGFVKDLFRESDGVSLEEEEDEKVVSLSLEKDEKDELEREEGKERSDGLVELPLGSFASHLRPQIPLHHLYCVPNILPARSELRKPTHLSLLRPLQRVPLVDLDLHGSHLPLLVHPFSFFLVVLVVLESSPLLALLSGESVVRLILIFGVRVVGFRGGGGGRRTRSVGTGSGRTRRKKGEKERR